MASPRSRVGRVASEPETGACCSVGSTLRVGRCRLPASEHTATPLRQFYSSDLSSCWSFSPIMTSVNAITRQLNALEISSKPNTQGSTNRPTHQKKPSASSGNVGKLLTKFAAPHPFNATHAKTGSASSLQGKQNVRPPSPTKTAPAPAATTTTTASRQPHIDIGTYDGALERENETRGEKVYGEAAEALALDSSVAR